MILKKIQKLLHDFLGWGYPYGMKNLDSFQSSYNCKYCSKSICQDSQSNWFHLN